jgi:hypothetical protein
VTYYIKVLANKKTSGVSSLFVPLDVGKIVVYIGNHDDIVSMKIVEEKAG